MDLNQNCFFLFANLVNKERIGWLTPIIHGFQSTLLFSEDSLYSMPFIEKNIREDNKTIIIYNNSEANKRGLSYPFGSSLDSEDYFTSIFANMRKIMDFKTIGYLCLNAPYMTNDAKFGLKILRVALSNSILPEFYGYLDGIHLLQPNQSPSEFTNIMNEFLHLKEAVVRHNQTFRAYFCARCATARGYINAKIIEGASIVNLKEIINRLKLGVPCLMADSFLVINPKFEEVSNNQELKSGSDEVSTAKSEVSIIITHSPYNSEYMFGGLSFGLACANQGIKTQIIFVEDAVFTLIKQEPVREYELQEFDILSVVEALDDTDNLSFYYYYPSLRERSLSDSPEINYNFVRPIDNHDFCDVLKISEKTIKFRNVLIF